MRLLIEAAYIRGRLLFEEIRYTFFFESVGEEGKKSRYVTSLCKSLKQVTTGGWVLCCRVKELIEEQQPRNLADRRLDSPLLKLEHTRPDTTGTSSNASSRPMVSSPSHLHRF